MTHRVKLILIGIISGILALHSFPVLTRWPRDVGTPVSDSQTSATAGVSSIFETQNSRTRESVLPGENAERALVIRRNHGLDSPESRSRANANARSARILESLQQLAEINTAQIYRVFDQSLALTDPDMLEFQAFLLATLEEYAGSSPGEVLAALIENAPTPEIRRCALELLAEASQELSTRDLKTALNDPEESIRKSTQALLAEMGTNGLLDATAQAVLESDETVRSAALTALEEMAGYAPVWEVAESLMHDPDPQVRLHALELMTYGDSEAAISWLLMALEDPDPDISERAEALLAELGTGS